MILEPKNLKNTKYSDNQIKDEIILEYLKWMEYIPEHWNLTKILGKVASELSDSDIRILNIIKLETIYIDIFKQYLKGNHKETKDKVLEYINKISINQYANMKLTLEELEYCKNVIIMYIRNDINIGINSLKNQEDRNMKDEFILYKLFEKKLEMKLSNIGREKIKKINKSKNNNNKIN